MCHCSFNFHFNIQTKKGKIIQMANVYGIIIAGKVFFFMFFFFLHKWNNNNIVLCTHQLIVKWLFMNFELYFAKFGVVRKCFTLSLSSVDFCNARNIIIILRKKKKYIGLHQTFHSIGGTESIKISRID